MFSRMDQGGGSGDERFSEELSQLKREGASVLVAGSVRTEQRQDLCRRLLGETAGQPRRRVLVSTAGDDNDGTQLIGTGGEAVDSETLTLINYATQARCTAVSQADDTGLNPTPSSTEETPIEAATLADLGIAISSAIDAFEDETGGLAPAELRVGVDSLVPLLEEYGTERVFKFVHLTNGRTRDVDGMIHYHLPMDRDSDVASVLAPLFDIVVELREQNDVFQERWTINDGNLSSGWLSIERS